MKIWKNWNPKALLVERKRVYPLKNGTESAEKLNIKLP